MSEHISSNIPQINLDNYEIKEIIRCSSYSVISKAIDKKTKKEVAIKAYYYTEDPKDQLTKVRGLNVSYADVPGLAKPIGYRRQLTAKERKNFKYREIKIPNSDKPVDFTGLVIIMNYYKNGDIFQLTYDYLNYRKNIMNPTIRSKIIFGVASMMKQLHQKNAIHRDLQNKNVLLNDELEPILCSFGISKFITNPLEMTFLIGSPLYMAPELFIDDVETYSFPVDVFAYGMFLYNMFTTKIMFSDKKNFRTQQRFMINISNGMRPIKPDIIPDCYWELIQCCWDGKPEKRPTFEDIVMVLKDDKFALSEFGMNTDLNELHRYQDKIEGKLPKPRKSTPPKPTPSKQSNSTVDFDVKSKKRLIEYESLLSYSNHPNNNDNFFIGEDEEKNHVVIGKVGEGATSITYKVQDKKSGHLFCKKVLKGSDNEQTDFKNLQNSMKEFQVLQQLNHPCICKVFGINTSEPVEGTEFTTVAMFLEFLDYKLDKVLKNYDIKNTLKIRIVIEVAHAMKYIHKNGIIHRDLKVENIMLNSVFNCKVVDFGLVRIHECLNEYYSFVHDSMTKGVGTFTYMSPEMLNEENYDYKTDVYSFGILLFYIFVGKLPKQNLKDKLDGKQIQLPDPSQSISKFCIELIKSCLLKDPKSRPSFEKIIIDLRKNNYDLASNADVSVLYHRDHELELFETK